MYSSILSDRDRVEQFELSEADRQYLEDKRKDEEDHMKDRRVPRLGGGGNCSRDDFPELTEKGFSKVQDSGQMQDFDTGSVRDTREGKGRFDLITPIALKRIAQHYENGAKKYKDRNWEKGQPVTRFFDSAMRHMNTLMELKIKGKPLDEDHLAAVAWNIMAIIHVEEMVKEGFLPDHLVDWPNPVKLFPPKKCHSEPGQV